MLNHTLEMVHFSHGYQALHPLSPDQVPLLFPTLYKREPFVFLTFCLPSTPYTCPHFRPEKCACIWSYVCTSLVVWCTALTGVVLSQTAHCRFAIIPGVQQSTLAAAFVKYLRLLKILTTHPLLKNLQQ